MLVRPSRILAIVFLSALAFLFILLSSGSAVSPMTAAPVMQLDPPDPPPDDIDIEPPADPPPPREWVMLEVEVVTPQEVNAGLRSKVNVVAKVHNRGNIAAQDVVVTLDGVAAFEAPEERIDEIKPGKHKNVNLKVELFGRFADPHTFAVRAEAANSVIPVYDYLRMTFAPLDGSRYFDDDSNIVLKAERLPRNRYRTFRGDLLRFELMPGRKENDALEIDVSGLLDQGKRDEGELALFYRSSNERKVEIPLTFEKASAKVAINLPGPGEYSLRYRDDASTRGEENAREAATATGGAEDELPTGWVPTFQSPTIADFSGSVSYEYPMVVHPGPNGLQPPLSLVYNSGQSNGTMGNGQGDPVGFGWSLTSRIDIVQSLFADRDERNRDCPGDNACLKLVDKDLVQSTENFYNQYTLNFQGHSYELIHKNGLDSNGQRGRYYAAGNAGMYIELCKSYLVDSTIHWSDSCKKHKEDGDDPQHSDQISRVFWIIKTADNTTYRLGYTPNSEQEISDGHAFGGDLNNQEMKVDNTALKWRVDTAIDYFGNKMAYVYDEDHFNGPGGEPDNDEVADSDLAGWDDIYVPASYLLHIYYDKYGVDEDGNDLFRYEVRFNYERIPPETYNQGAINDELSWQTRFLESIEVRKGTSILREYYLYHQWEKYGTGSAYEKQKERCSGFDYDQDNDGDTDYVPDKTNLLTAITENVIVNNKPKSRICAPNDNESHCAQNPDRVFEYSFWETGEINQVGVRDHLIFCSPYMQSFETLYGPADPNVPTVSYDFNNKVVYPDSAYRDDDDFDSRQYTDLYYHTVKKQTVYSGSDNDAPPMVTEYQYGNANFEGVSNALQGFTSVTSYEGGPPSGGWQRKAVMNFWAEPYFENDSTLTGKSKDLSIHDASKELLKEETSWIMLHYSASGANGVNPNSRHPVVSVQKSTDKRGGGSALTRIGYKYDIYGNRTKVQEFDEDADPGEELYRTLETLYVYNTDTDEENDYWLVNLPWRETMWVGDAGGPEAEIVWRNRYRYDDSDCSDPDKKPTKGRLLFLDQYEKSSLNGANADPNRNGGPNYDCGAKWLTTNYYYGNYVHGGQNMGEIWQLTRVLDPGGIQQDTKWLDRTRKAKTIDYARRNSSSPVVELHTSFAYSDAYSPWLVTQVTGVNGAKQAFEYDPFGRLITVKSPNPLTGAANHVTRQIAYHDTGNPLHIDVLTPDPNGGHMRERTFYDAIGRPLQNRLWDISDNFKQSITDIQYDSLGRTQCEMLAIGGTAPDFSPGLNCFNYGHITTYYDALDDVIRVTEPNGQYTRYVYGNRQKKVVDANNNATVYLYDALGRLSGTWEPPTGDHSAHTTTYEYDLADNLTKVLGANNATTTMTYNNLGQKVSMADADMGEWSYAYDDSGNMVRQTDAKGQRICFYYDSGGRLISKRHDGFGSGKCPASFGGTNLGSYVYYASGTGKGQVQKITYWYADRYNDNFVYDYRGRVTRQTREINDVTFTKDMTYDNLDRPQTVSYPNGEVITITYDGRFADKLESTVDGVTAPVVAGLVYNQRHQQTAIYRPGNVPNTSFIYHNETQNFRLKRIQQRNWQDKWPDFEYQYDAVGNITSKKMATENQVETDTFTYDARDRLKTAKNSNGPQPYDYTYTYGSGGNIAWRYDNNGPDDRQYLYYDDQEHHKHALKEIKVGGQRIAYFTYDNNGNMLSRQVNGVTYTQVWNRANQLQEVTVNGQETNFRYDADGQRVYTLLPDGRKIYTPWPSASYRKLVSCPLTVTSCSWLARFQTCV